MQKEKAGIIFVLTSAAMWGIFPVIVNRGVQSMPPLTYAAITTLLAACGAFVYAAATGKLYELKNRKSYKSLIMVTLCIVFIPQVLFFIGTSKTTGLNSSLLLLSEIIFTLIFTPFIGERTTAKKLLGAIGVFFGAAVVLYKGSFSINTGDVLIILSTATYPLGNYYAKKAFNYVSPTIILFVRFLLAGIFMLVLSFAIESPIASVNIFLHNWPLVLFTGLFLLGINKIIWYEGLKRLDISKAISLAITFPVFSLITLAVFFNEIPSIQQLIGIMIMGLGVYFSIKRKSTDQSLTKYAAEV